LGIPKVSSGCSHVHLNVALLGAAGACTPCAHGSWKRWKLDLLRPATEHCPCCEGRVFHGRFGSNGFCFSHKWGRCINTI
jgi:hypothetical protein